jgi:hypothetical protein
MDSESVTLPLKYPALPSSPTLVDILSEIVDEEIRDTYALNVRDLIFGRVRHLEQRAVPTAEMRVSPWLVLLTVGSVVGVGGCT